MHTHIHMYMFVSVYTHTLSHLPRASMPAHGGWWRLLPCIADAAVSLSGGVPRVGADGRQDSPRALSVTLHATHQAQEGPGAGGKAVLTQKEIAGMVIWSLCFTRWGEMSFISVSNCERGLACGRYHFRAHSLIRFAAVVAGGFRELGTVGGASGDRCTCRADFVFCDSGTPSERSLRPEIAFRYLVKHVVLIASTLGVKISAGTAVHSGPLNSCESGVFQGILACSENKRS